MFTRDIFQKILPNSHFASMSNHWWSLKIVREKSANFCDSSLINISLDMKNTCICRKSTSWVAVVEFDRYINKNAKLDEILGGAYLYLLLKINELRVMLGFLTLTNLLHPRGEKWAYSGLVLSFCSKSFSLRSSLASYP